MHRILFASLFAWGIAGVACGPRPGGSGRPPPGAAAPAARVAPVRRADPVGRRPRSTVASPACPASEAGDTPTGQDTMSPGSVTAFTYTNVGSMGAYDKVVDGWSKATGCVADTSGMLCDTVYRMPVEVSGPITPFDDLSMTSGAGRFHQIAVYTPSGGGHQQTAYWDLVLHPGPLRSSATSPGTSAAGSSRATSTGTAPRRAPRPCSSAAASRRAPRSTSCPATCTGPSWRLSSGLALGFSGDAAGSKIFVTKFRMPISTSTPAYWILPGQVLRSRSIAATAVRRAATRRTRALRRAWTWWASPAACRRRSCLDVDLLVPGLLRRRRPVGSPGERDGHFRRDLRRPEQADRDPPPRRDRDWILPARSRRGPSAPGWPIRARPAPCLGQVSKAASLSLPWAMKPLIDRRRSGAARAILVLAAVCLSAAGCRQSSAATPEARELFAATCARCHGGLDGGGGIPSA